MKQEASESGKGKGLTLDQMRERMQRDKDATAAARVDKVEQLQHLHEQTLRTFMRDGQWMLGRLQKQLASADKPNPGMIQTKQSLEQSLADGNKSLTYMIKVTGPDKHVPTAASIRSLEATLAKVVKNAKNVTEMMARRAQKQPVPAAQAALQGDAKAAVAVKQEQLELATPNIVSSSSGSSSADISCDELDLAFADVAVEPGDLAAADVAADAECGNGGVQDALALMQSLQQQLSQSSSNSSADSQQQVQELTQILLAVLQFTQTALAKLQAADAQSRDSESAGIHDADAIAY
jgi:hypothetical protein